MTMKTFLKFALVALLLMLFGGSARAQCSSFSNSQVYGQIQTCVVGVSVSQGMIVGLNSSVQVVPAPTSLSAGIFGVALQSGSPGSAVLILISGQAGVSTDNACSFGQLIIVSTTIAGNGHCVTTSTVQYVGTALATTAAAGSPLTQVSALSSGTPGSSSGSSFPVTSAVAVNSGGSITVNSGGSIAPAGTGTVTSNSITNAVPPSLPQGNIIYAATSCPTGATNCYVVKNDLRWSLAATFSTSATTCNGTTVPAGTCVTILSTDPPFVCPGGSFPCTSGGSVGMIAEGTVDCLTTNPGQCLASIPQTTISKVIDAQHAQVANAATANPVGGTGTTFAWGGAGGVGDGAQLQAAFNAANSLPGSAVVLPCGGNAVGSTGGSGGMIVDQSLSVGGNSVPYAPGVYGCPGQGTMLFLLINPTGGYSGGATAFSYSNAEFGQVINSITTFGTVENLFFWGAGEPVNVFSTSSGQIVAISGANVQNVWLYGYLWNVATSFVLDGLTVQGGTVVNSGSYAGGNFPCRFVSSFFGLVATTSVCGGSAGNGLTVFNSSTGAGGVTTMGGYFYAGINTPFYGVVMDPTSGTNVYTDIGSYIGSLNITRGKVKLIGSHLDRGQPANTNVILQSGGDLSLQDTQIVNGSSPFLAISAGIFRDECGNVGMNAPTVTGGVYSGNCSVAGTALTTGAVVPSANWGTSAAISAPFGETRDVSFTLTNGSASVGASPTLTYTFPTPFEVRPNYCTITQTGGTQAQIANEFTVGTPTTTSVVFTYNATPTINLTEILAVRCY
jgi:hypothetical protein